MAGEVVTRRFGSYELLLTTSYHVAAKSGD
jgi:hypothetical protein